MSAGFVIPGKGLGQKTFGTADKTNVIICLTF
jgi:hypothetical protein